MIERFDHAVIAVPDLETGMDAFRRLGFEVAVGGRHPSLGTRNAIVRFGLDYLELLTVEDPATARSRGPFGQELLAYLLGGLGVGRVRAGRYRSGRRGRRAQGVGPRRGRSVRDGPAPPPWSPTGMEAGATRRLALAEALAVPDRLDHRRG